MKAKIFVGNPKTGKTRVARIIFDLFNNESAIYLNADILKAKPIHTLELDFKKLDLVIFDDCSLGFDYSFFLENKNQHNCCLIFTTNKIKQSWLDDNEFCSYFEIIQFPLSN